MADDRVILQDFPAIAKHWASCTLGCIEAVCKYQFDTPTLADCQYDHTFSYERPHGGIQRDADGTNLALAFQALPVSSAAGAQRIRELYGIESRRHFLRTASEFEHFALEVLRGGRALAIVFDWFYVAGRREYQRIHAPHTMCLVGIDIGGGLVHLVDQYHGRLKVPREVFAGFIDFSSQDGREGAQLMEFLQLATFSPSDTSRLPELQRNLERFLDNLQSSDRSRGLGALQAFRDELNAFMDVERSAPAVFYVPGLWEFGMQRAHFAEALRVIETFHPVLSSADGHELLGALEALHRRWCALNFDAEAALLKNRPHLLAKAFAGLDAIICHEGEMPRRFERLLHALK